MAIETQSQRVGSPENDPNKLVTKPRVFGLAIIAAAGIIYGVIRPGESAETPLTNVEQVAGVADQAFAEAGVDPNTFESIDPTDTNADAESGVVSETQSEIITYNGIELPNHIELNKGKSGFNFALLNTTADLLESSLLSNNVDFFSKTAFVEDAFGAEALFERFSVYQSSEDFYILPTLGGDDEARPTDIVETMPNGFATEQDGDILAGFNIKVLNLQNVVVDEQWVIARYSEEGALPELGWGLSGIEFIEN